MSAQSGSPFAREGGLATPFVSRSRVDHGASSKANGIRKLRAYQLLEIGVASSVNSTVVSESEAGIATAVGAAIASATARVAEVVDPARGRCAPTEAVDGGGVIGCGVALRVSVSHRVLRCGTGA